MEFMPTQQEAFMASDDFFVATADDRRAGSPTIAWRVRPGGALAFSEAMTFSPTKGGWLANAQLESSNWSPGKASVNRNIKMAEPTGVAAPVMDEKAMCARA